MKIFTILLVSLFNQCHISFFEVKDHGRVPVARAVDVALTRRRHNEVSERERQFDYPVAEVEFVYRVVRHIANPYLLTGNHCSFKVLPFQSSESIYLFVNLLF